MSREITEIIINILDIEARLIEAYCESDTVNISRLQGENREVLAKLAIEVEKIESERDKYKAQLEEIRDLAEQKSMERDLLT